MWLAAIAAPRSDRPDRQAITGTAFARALRQAWAKAGTSRMPSMKSPMQVTFGSSTRKSM